MSVAIGSRCGRHMSACHVRQDDHNGVWFVGLYNERGLSFGTLLRGGWSLARPSSWWPWFECGVTAGGDENTVALAVTVAGFRASIGVRVPGALLRRWVYDSREFSVSLGGGTRVRFAHDWKLTHCGMAGGRWWRRRRR